MLGTGVVGFFLLLLPVQQSVNDLLSFLMCVLDFCWDVAPSLATAQELHEGWESAVNGCCPVAQKCQVGVSFKSCAS